MGKQCCDIKVSEIEGGYRIEIKSEDFNESCASFIKNCCNNEEVKKMFQACCTCK